MKNLNIISIAKEVIKIELNALKKLSLNIGKSFDKLIYTIINCRNGKIIISGVGKSGIIAKKWASTFSSTGTPSFFLEASNASHGDLGQITSNDVVILISLSGQSEELKNIIQYSSRNKNIKLIGVTANKESILYKNSDVKFLLPTVKEAGPDNFVPTSSTTVQIALGDAIAISCMRYKKFHPGGTLSVKLKTVEDLMLIGNRIPFISDKTKMKIALMKITNNGLGVLVIRNRQKKTIGILTDGDIKRLSNKKSNFQDLEIRTVMTKSPISIHKTMLAAQALSLMNTKKITSLCVHNNNSKKNTIGFIHIHDILDANIT